jgi:hypothetical protein
LLEAENRGAPPLEAEDFQGQVSLFQPGLSLAAGLGSYQDFP